MNYRRWFVPALTAAGVLLLVGAVWLEQAEPTVWQERLAWPRLHEPREANRHTPAVAEGTFLPPTLTASRTLTAADSPIIIPGRVYVPANVTLTLAADTEVLVHEYGYLDVAGNLQVNGTPVQPVQFSTNEVHPANRHWAGIVFAPNSHGTITGAAIRHASPGITCAKGSTVAIHNTTIELGNLGIFTASPTCSVTASTIRAVDIGVIGAGVSPRLLNTVIHAAGDDVKTF